MRKFLILMIVSLITFGYAGAQDTSPTFCGELSDDDCTILINSAQAMRELASAAFEFDMGFSVGGLPDTRPDSISFRLGGYGSYAIEPGLLNVITTSPSEMIQDFSQLPQLIEATLQGISADTTLILFFPDDLTQLASKEGTHLPDKAGLSLRLVDGVGYINLDKLAELDTEGDLPRGWIGIDLVEFFNQALEESGVLDEMVIPETNPEMMGDFSDPDFMKQFMTIERIADTEIDGQTAAVFQTSIDLDALFSSPDFLAMLQQQLETGIEASGGEGINEEDLADVMTLYSTLFDGFVIDMTQTIGTDDGFVHELNVAFDWSIDFTQMLAGFGEMDGAMTSPPIELSFDFQVKLSQFNNAPVISAPEDAQIIPLDDLFQGNMSGLLSILAR